MAKDDDFPFPTPKDAKGDIPKPPKPTEVAENLPEPPELPEPFVPEFVEEMARKDPKIPDVDVPPRVLDYLFENMPEEVAQNVEFDTARLMSLPAKIDEDIATLMVFLTYEPREVLDDLYEMPGDLPGQLRGFVETLREGLEYSEMEEKDRGERMRRITDVIDLFTPT